MTAPYSSFTAAGPGALEHNTEELNQQVTKKDKTDSEWNCAERGNVGLLMCLIKYIWHSSLWHKK